MSGERPDFGEIRKMYVSARIETIPNHVLAKSGMNWRQAAKSIAHQEFNEFVQELRKQAVEAYQAKELPDPAAQALRAVRIQYR